MSAREEPDCTWIHRERTRPGVTLQRLHVEYLEKYPGGYQYTAFCDRFRAWCARRGLVMRHVHVAGDKLFVDYSGKRPSIVDRATGEVIPVELFVAVLGGSNYTYAEATLTQRGPDWIASHVRALEYMGGVPKALVCDQLKSGVTRACRYEPEVQRTYEDLATHYGTTVLPARPYKPRDKAKVEGTVLIVQRWILARIRNEVFHSLAALNTRIRELLVDLNARVMRRYGKSRRELFESTSTKRCGCARRRRPSRSCFAIGASRCTRDHVHAVASRRSRRTCRARIVRRQSGHPRASSPGRRRWGRRCTLIAPQSSNSAGIQSRASSLA